ncbi:hypothetical protein DE146DRAFT_732239 [Phaeosphaeria sp. MPI-PUGE-AT-0046c]|nr:hypothetical protein DE146DRAFT_732239 [Phaeosphaeria sp. MPI-PUGE-AT-0046c]
MPFQLFRSRGPGRSRCNTIKKAEPLNGHINQLDLQPEKDNRIVDITNVGAWVKESSVDKSHDGIHNIGAVLKVNTQEVIREEHDPGTTQGCGVMDTSNHEPQPQQMVGLIIGRQDSSSAYLTRRYISIPSTTIPSSIQPSTSVKSTQVMPVVTFPDLDPHAFELYQVWLHHDTIPFRSQLSFDPTLEKGPKSIWQTCWPLFNAHILGCKIDATNFVDQVMDLLGSKLSGSSSPDIETIQHLFTKEGDDISKVLKDFVADQYIAAGTVAKDLDASTAEKYTRILRIKLHRNFPPQDLRRQQRLDLDRQNSSNDAQEVARNAYMHDIQTIDWEERRANEIRATTLQATVVEDVLGTVQTDDTGGEVAKSVLGQEAASAVGLTKDSGIATRLLHPSLTRTASGHVICHPTDTSEPCQDVMRDSKAKGRPVLPGAYPISRHGSLSSILSNGF